MFPESHLSTTAVRGQLVNPWVRRADMARHWGPIALNDASQGLHVRLWTVRVNKRDVFLAAPGVPEFLWYTHTEEISEVSLAFNQNGDAAVAFVDQAGDAFLRWFDPVPSAVVNLALSSDTVNPRITLDDDRPFNLGNSDIILGYVRAGVLRYRLQRDRFTVEYTPPIGAGGVPAPAQGLRHVSMSSKLRVEFLTDNGGDQDWTLPQIIEDVSSRASLPQERLNLAGMDWEKVVRGYTVGASYTASGVLQTLSAVFFFDPSNANGKVAFLPRARDTVATILDEDMIDSEEEVADSQNRRNDSIGVPRVLHLNYYDAAGGLNTDKQRSERPEGTRADGEQSLQTPIVMSSTEAATVLKITHGMMVEQQKGELNFRLPDNWLRITESDPVFVQVDQKMVRAILTLVDTDDGEQRYRAIRDRQSLYRVVAEGIPAAPVTRPPSSIAGPTLVEFLDIPIMRDIHDQLGFYMAVSGVLPAWPGASVELSLDGGATYLDSQSTRSSSVMGELTTALESHPHEFPDTVHSCQVQIQTPNALLENTDLAGLLNRRNRALIGNEIVAFADADEVTPGVWELSTWLRGRKGTTATAHAVGDRFVMLASAMFIPADLTWLNRTLTFRATTFGRPVDEATMLSVVFTGQSQTERRPAYLQARRDGANVVASWQGVGRLGGGANVAMGAYFQGYRVTLTDGTTTQTVDTLSSTFTGSLAAFTGPVTVRVQQRNQFTGPGPQIEVIV